MKFSNLGIIKIKMPAMSAMIGEMCAVVRVTTISEVLGSDDLRGGGIICGHPTQACDLTATITRIRNHEQPRGCELR
jgi:hypothetical protein